MDYQYEVTVGNETGERVIGSFPRFIDASSCADDFIKAKRDADIFFLGETLKITRTLDGFVLWRRRV